MDKQAIIDLLQAVADGALSPEKAYSRLRLLPFEELGYAKVDHHRSMRKGSPEVIFGAGKTADQIKGIASAMLKNGTRSILITRLDEEAAKILGAELEIEYDHVSRTAVIAWDKEKKACRLRSCCFRRHKRYTRMRRSRRNGTGSWQPRHKAVRCGCGRYSQAPEQFIRFFRRQGRNSRCGYGRRSAKRYRRSRGLSRYCRSHQCGIRFILRRTVRTAHNAEFLRQRHIGG